MQGIAVFLSARMGSDPEHAARTADLGSALAAAGVPLVYGGASVGLMGVLADATLAGGGTVIGVIPQSMVERELVHRGLTELIIVGDMAERKAVMATRADGFLILPGGFGTLDEMFEMLTGQQLGLHSKPTVVLDPDGYYDGLFTWLDRAAADDLLTAPYRAMVGRVTSIPDALRAFGR